MENKSWGCGESRGLRKLQEKMVKSWGRNATSAEPIDQHDFLSSPSTFSVREAARVPVVLVRNAGFREANSVQEETVQNSLFTARSAQEKGSTGNQLIYPGKKPRLSVNPEEARHRERHTIDATHTVLLRTHRAHTGRQATILT